MATSRTDTKWIAMGAALAVVCVVAAAVLVVALVGGRGGTDVVDDTTTTTPTPSTSPTSTTTDPTASTEPDDIVVERVTVPGDVERVYTVVTPKAAPPDAELPVVLALHGLGVDAAQMMNAADWRGAVVEHSFMAVFPQGLSNSWNIGPCCPPANLIGVDDTVFLDQVIDEVLARGDTDADRVYMTGFSNGALMTYSYACANPATFAAIAPMSGSNVTGCTPSQPLSMLHQHSDPDLVVPFHGGLALGALVSSAPFPDVPGSVAAWAAADECPAEPQRLTEDDGVQRWRWTGCADDTKVELVMIPGVGHTWPTTPTYDGLDEMLGFFGLT